MGVGIGTHCVGDQTDRIWTFHNKCISTDSVVCDEGILDGDFVLVKKQSTARNGEQVVALLPDGETTLKTFFREQDGRIRLQPANSAFNSIIVDDCQVQGVITGVLRSYS